jgi:hypothetical protein
MAVGLAREIGADLKVIIVLKPLPACFSFAVSAIFASIWRKAQLQKSTALQAQARLQMRKAGIYADVELVTGNEVRNYRKIRERIPGGSDCYGNEKPHDRDRSYYSGCG